MAIANGTIVKIRYYNAAFGFFGPIAPAKISLHDGSSYTVDARNENGDIIEIDGLERRDIRIIRRRRAQCSICHEVLQYGRQPLITKCGHIFCCNCIIRVIYTQDDPKCPDCMTRVQEDEFQSPQFLNDEDYVICGECEQYIDKNIEPRKYEMNFHSVIRYNYADGGPSETTRYRVCNCICDFCAFNNHMSGNPRVFINYN